MSLKVTIINLCWSMRSMFHLSGSVHIKNLIIHLYKNEFQEDNYTKSDEQLTNLIVLEPSKLVISVNIKEHKHIKSKLKIKFRIRFQQQTGCSQILVLCNRVFFCYSRKDQKSFTVKENK